MSAQEDKLMADTPELNEEQFLFLKGVIDANVFLLLIPAIQDDDPAEQKEKHAHVIRELRDLVAKKFLDDKDPEFAEMIEEVKKQRQRPFHAFGVTELAVQMFAPKEGSVN
jgi:hypothetical protein